MKKVKTIMIITAVVVVIILGLFVKSRIDLNRQRESILQEQEENQKLQKRVEEVLAENGKVLDEKSAVEEQLEQLKETVVEEKIVLDAATIEDEMKDIGELATAEYLYTNVGTFDDVSVIKNTNIKIPGTAKTIVATMDGTIKAGVETDKIQISVDEEKRTIFVTVPNAIILSNELDEKSLTVFDESSGIFTKIKVEDTSGVREQIKTKAEETAKNSGLLDQAKKNAEILLENMLLSGVAKESDYVVEFK